MNTDYQIPFIYRIFRRILRAFFKTLFHILGPVTITGKENIPQEGPYLIAANHVSILEIPFIGAFWPIFPEIIGAANVWERPGLALFARMYHGLPVRRGEYEFEDSFDKSAPHFQIKLPLKSLNYSFGAIP